MMLRELGLSGARTMMFKELEEPSPRAWVRVRVNGKFIGEVGLLPGGREHLARLHKLPDGEEVYVDLEFSREDEALPPPRYVRVAAALKAAVREAFR